MNDMKMFLVVVLVGFFSISFAADGPHRSPSGKAYPAHWGEPPLRQTKDLRVLPGEYGRGSGTLAKWIKGNMDRDAAAAAFLPGGEVKKKGRFPAHWGEPPKVQTRDLRPLPGGYGKGSGTLAKWIQQNLDRDAAMAKGGEKKPGVKKDNPDAAEAAKAAKKAEIALLRKELETAEWKLENLRTMMSRTRLTGKAYEAKMEEVRDLEKWAAGLRKQIAELR